MVLQQDLNIANALLSTDKGEGDHSLCQQNIKNTNVSMGLKREENKHGLYKDTKLATIISTQQPALSEAVHVLK